MRRAIYLALLLVWLTGCGTDSSGTLLQNLPGAVSIPNPPPGSENPGSGTGGTGPGAPPSSSALSCITTTGPGCMYLESVESIPLNASQEVMGFAADSSNSYLLLKEDIGNGISYWRLYAKGLSGTSWAVKCSLLDDGGFQGQLAIDSSYFYVVGWKSGDSLIRRFSISTCQEASAIQPAGGVSSDASSMNTYYSEAFGFSQDDGTLYFPNAAGTFSSYDLTTTAYTPLSVNQTLGGASLTDHFSIWTVFHGNRWFLDLADLNVWELNALDAAQAWSPLPAETYEDLRSTIGLATPDGNRLLLLTRPSSSSVNVYTFDVTAFTSGSVAPDPGGVTENSDSIPASSFQGCPANSYATSAQGCLGLRAIDTLPLGTTQTFEGFATSASSWYVLMRENLGNSVTYWRFYQRSLSGDAWSLSCSILDDGRILGQLAVDSGYFYVIGWASNAALIRRFALSTCIEAPALQPPGGVSSSAGDLNQYYSEAFGFSADAGSPGALYFPDSGGELTFLDLASSAVSGTALSLSLGTASINGDFSLWSVYGGTKWLVDLANHNLWEVNGSNAAVAWAGLPTSTYLDLYSVVATGTPDGKTIVLVTLSSGILKFYSFDVSAFTSGTGSTSQGTVSSASYSLPVAFAGCASGYFTTTSPGCLGVNAVTDIPLGGGQTLMGFAADSAGEYLLIETSSAWLVSEVPTGSSTPSIVCTIPNTGSISGQLAVDANYFYTVGWESPNYVILSFSRSNCAQGGVIQPTGGVSSNAPYFDSYSSYAFGFSQDSGVLFFTNASSTFSALNLASGSVSETSLIQGLGDQTLSGYSDLWSVTGGIRWVVDLSNELLWKLGGSNEALGWGALPTATYSDFNSTVGMAPAPESGELLLATQPSTSTIRVYTLDVSGF